MAGKVQEKIGGIQDVSLYDVVEAHVGVSLCSSLKQSRTDGGGGGRSTAGAAAASLKGLTIRSNVRDMRGTFSGRHICS